MPQEWLIGPSAALALALVILWLGVKDEPAWYKRSEYKALEERRQSEHDEAAARLQACQDEAREAVADWQRKYERMERLAYSFTDLGERFARVLEAEKGTPQ